MVLFVHVFPHFCAEVKNLPEYHLRILRQVLPVTDSAVFCSYVLFFVYTFSSFPLFLRLYVFLSYSYFLSCYFFLTRCLGRPFTNSGCNSPMIRGLAYFSYPSFRPQPSSVIHSSGTALSTLAIAWISYALVPH